ncbi:MAG: type I-E CRISPR-associated protein Cas5/CasD [Nitrospinae bacterium]|nr:type I-E CRISPR-associated protein Cas5/CasD [Nitrospinota bacterium]
MNENNTLFLRLAGLMQSWGTSSRFQLRRTDLYPSKSGVLGLLLCAMGIRREDSSRELKRLTPFLMGVRIDRKGRADWDYHTAGAKIGIRSADGKIKITQSTGEFETLLSRRQYLYDSSFLIALQGDSKTIGDCAKALNDPVWPMFLGRKCCVPSEPVFAGVGRFNTLTDALLSVPWQPRIIAIDCDNFEKTRTRTLDVYIEHPTGSEAPKEAMLLHDNPIAFGFYSYAPRWVVPDKVEVVVGKQASPPRPDDFRSPDRSAIKHRMETDNHLCVFCKSPAVEVHHVTYENVGSETDADLRSLCWTCHRACTMLEYGHDRARRVDPSDPDSRRQILHQIEILFGKKILELSSDIASEKEQ